MTLDDFDADAATTAAQPTIPNGVWTISFPCGTHKTLRIHTQRSGPLRGRRLVSLLIGPQNTDDYETIGELIPAEPGYFVWKRWQGKRPGDYIGLLVLMARGEVLEGHGLLASKTCLVCNRPLTTPTSLARLIGDECFRRMNGGGR